MTEPHDTARQPGSGETRPEARDLAEEIGVQYEGISVGGIMGFVAVVILAVVLLVTVGFVWAGAFSQQLHEEMAASAEYPETREVELQAARKLNQYGVIDQNQGIYRIPIDRAIDLMVNEAYQAPGGDYSQELQLQPGN
ncbi:MAG: hypothetical protein ACE5G0_04070 [Rhodothermales bacterium]